MKKIGRVIPKGFTKEEIEFTNKVFKEHDTYNGYDNIRLRGRLKDDLSIYMTCDHEFGMDKSNMKTEVLVCDIQIRKLNDYVTEWELFIEDEGNNPNCIVKLEDSMFFEFCKVGRYAVVFKNNGDIEYLKVEKTTKLDNVINSEDVKFVVLHEDTFYDSVDEISLCYYNDKYKKVSEFILGQGLLESKYRMFGL